MNLTEEGRREQAGSEIPPFSRAMGRIDDKSRGRGQGVLGTANLKRLHVCTCTCLCVRIRQSHLTLGASPSLSVFLLLISLTSSIVAPPLASTRIRSQEPREYHISSSSPIKQFGNRTETITTRPSPLIVLPRQGSSLPGPISRRHRCRHYGCRSAQRAR